MNFGLAAHGQNCPVEYGFRYTHNFPRETKAFLNVTVLSKMSPVVVGRIQEQLNKRVGEKFGRRIRLDYCSLRDFDESTLLKPNDISRIDGYDCVYKFSDRKKGLKAFYFKVVANEKGDLIEELPLPNIAADELKGNLISCKQALEIAERNGFPRNQSSIYFWYDWDSQSLAWHVHDRRAVEPDQPLFMVGKGTYRKIIIDAATGKVIRTFKETIIV